MQSQTPGFEREIEEEEEKCLNGFSRLSFTIIYHGVKAGAEMNQEEQEKELWVSESTIFCVSVRSWTTTTSNNGK